MGCYDPGTTTSWTGYIKDLWMNDQDIRSSTDTWARSMSGDLFGIVNTYWAWFLTEDSDYYYGYPFYAYNSYTAMTYLYTLDGGSAPPTTTVAYVGEGN